MQKLYKIILIAIKIQGVPSALCNRLFSFLMRTILTAKWIFEKSAACARKGIHFFGGSKKSLKFNNIYSISGKSLF